MGLLIRMARRILIHPGARFKPQGGPCRGEGSCRVGAQHRGFSMSGYLRIYFASLVLVGGLSATPAFSNAFTDIFSIAPREPAATAPAQPECLARPGNAPGAGQRWMYRLDGHRRCWFLAEGAATVRKPNPGRLANRAARPDENETARQRRSPVIDARAELPRSAPADGAPTMPPAREFKVADAASEPGTVPVLTSAARIAELHSRRPMTDHSVPGQVDVEQLLAAADAGPSVDPPAMVIGVQIADEVRSWTSMWLGALLMTLGVLSVLSASRTLRLAMRLDH